jgi:hypothetical protein
MTKHYSTVLEREGAGILTTSNECFVIIYGLQYGNSSKNRDFDSKYTQKRKQKLFLLFEKKCSKLIICEIWDPHCGNYEDYRILGCDAV